MGFHIIMFLSYNNCIFIKNTISNFLCNFKAKYLCRNISMPATGHIFFCLTYTFLNTLYSNMSKCKETNTFKETSIYCFVVMKWYLAAGNLQFCLIISLIPFTASLQSNYATFTVINSKHPCHWRIRYLTIRKHTSNAPQMYILWVRKDESVHSFRTVQ